MGNSGQQCSIALMNNQPFHDQGLLHRIKGIRLTFDLERPVFGGIIDLKTGAGRQESLRAFGTINDAAN